MNGWRLPYHSPDQQYQQARQYNLGNLLPDLTGNVIPDVLDFTVMAGVPAAPLGFVFFPALHKIVPGCRPRRLKLLVVSILFGQFAEPSIVKGKAVLSRPIIPFPMA